MCVSSVYGHMADHDKLQKYAATIMAHFEDANLVAMEIQGHNKSLTDISHGLEAIRIELQAIDNILSKVNVLTTNSNSQ